MDPLMPLAEVMATPGTISLVRRFARAVAGADHEKLWTLLGNGRLVKTSGGPDEVESPDTGKELVLLEIHQHRITDAVADGRAGAFLHLRDIGASFAAGPRAFGTYIVLVDVPGTPYLVATKFRDAALRELMGAGSGPLDRLFDTIERTHAEPLGFARKTLGAPTIHAMKRAFEGLLPELDFAVLGLSKRGPFPRIA